MSEQLGEFLMVMIEEQTLLILQLLVTCSLSNPCLFTSSFMNLPYVLPHFLLTAVTSTPTRTFCANMSPHRSSL